MSEHPQSTPTSSHLTGTDRLPGLVDDPVAVTMAAQADHVVALIAAGAVPDEVRAVCRACHTSPAMLAAVLAAVQVASDRVDGAYRFTGFLHALVGVGRCYRSVRRGFKAARQLGLLAGDAADVYHDDRTGRFGRPVATYARTLPRWVGRCRTWRSPRGPGGPATRAVPASAPLAPPRDVQTLGANVPDFPVDNGDWRAGRPIPADARAAIDRLMAKKRGGRARH